MAVRGAFEGLHRRSRHAPEGDTPLAWGVPGGRTRTPGNEVIRPAAHPPAKDSAHRVRPRRAPAPL